jgi:hypothetical protein
MQLLEIVPWERGLAAVIGLVGLLTFWRGMLGGRGGECGLVRRHISMLDRLIGWRLTLVGLTLAGIGAAWFWDLRWLLVLSLGIGFVEIHEATHILKAWRWSTSSSVSRSRKQPQAL